MLVSSQFIILLNDKATNSFVHCLFNLARRRDFVNSILHVEHSGQLLLGNDFGALLDGIPLFIEVSFLIVVLIFALFIFVRLDNSVLCDDTSHLASGGGQSLTKLINLQSVTIEVVTEGEVEPLGRHLSRRNVLLTLGLPRVRRRGLGIAILSALFNFSFLNLTELMALCGLSQLTFLGKVLMDLFSLGSIRLFGTLGRLTFVHSVITRQQFTLGGINKIIITEQ